MPTSRFFRLLRLVFSLCLLVLLFYWVPIGNFLNALAGVSYGFVTIAFLLTLVNFSLSISKLNITLNTLGNDLRILDVARAYYVGTFFNNFIPTSVGGDVIKTYELNKTSRGTLSDDMLSVAVERLTGIAVLGGLAVYFLFLNPTYYRNVGLSFIHQGQLWTLVVLLLSAFMLVGTWIVTDAENDEANNTWASNLREWIHFPSSYPGTTVVLIVLSGFLHLSRAIIFLLLARGFGVNLSIPVALFVLPIIAFSAFLPISMGGIGLREGIITFCLNAFGVPIDTSFGVSVIFRLFSLVHSTIGGIVYSLTPLSAE